MKDGNTCPEQQTLVLCGPGHHGHVPVVSRGQDPLHVVPVLEHLPGSLLLAAGSHATEAKGPSGLLLNLPRVETRTTSVRNRALF